MVLRNNILWVKGSGSYAISVAADSQVNFDSDYNVLYTPAAGQLGLWGSFAFDSLVDWYYELGLDLHSQTTDPQFVDPDEPMGS